MGCLSEEEREKILTRFREAQESIGKEIRRRRRRIREAAANAQDPYRQRLLDWAADNWDLMESIADEEAKGLFGAAFAALPHDLRTDMEERRVSGPKHTLTAEDRERIEIDFLYSEERYRTGSPCPDTEVRLKELNSRRKQRGEKKEITVEHLAELNRRIVTASRVDDPADLAE